MTPDVAIKVLEEATGLICVNRVDQFKILQAIDILKKLIEPKKVEE